MTQKKFRLYVVFEENNKIKTREIFVECTHPVLINLKLCENLALLKEDLGLSEDDVVHGAVYIGETPTKQFLEYLFAHIQIEKSVDEGFELLDWVSFRTGGARDISVDDRLEGVSFSPRDIYFK